MMTTIGWPLLLLILIIGLRLGGVSLGLLSGLCLGLLAFSVQPTAPPNDLMLLQATWLLLMATLEATGFFYLLEVRLKPFIEKSNQHYGLFTTLFCYGLVFLTGDNQWLHRCLRDQNGPLSHRPRLLVAIGIAAHMALLASPLSISGILLIVVAGNSGLAILDLVGRVVAITASITAMSSLLAGLVPNKWLPCAWLKAAAPDDAQVITPSTKKVQLTFLLLLLAVALFLLTKPEANRLTGLNSKIFPVRFPIFFALVMLSIAAVAMLVFQLKPAKILQSYRFKLGIQQFFIFLGLAWLLDSLISHDKTYLIKTVCDNRADYSFYLVLALYMLLIDIPIVIWLFSGFLIGVDGTIGALALWLVFVHSLTPIRCWISHIIQAYKKKY